MPHITSSEIVEKLDLQFIGGIVALCILSFFIGLMTWFVIARRLTLTWIRQIRAMLIGSTIAAVVFVLIAETVRYVVAFDRLSRNAEERAWLVLAPVALTGILSAHILALHLRVRRLEHNAAQRPAKTD
jgi:hypothetical protein